MTRFKPGMEVVYNGASNQQVKWGLCDDPRLSILSVGSVYTVKSVDTHNWYTSVILNEVNGVYNSVLFTPRDEAIKPV